MSQHTAAATSAAKVAKAAKVAAAAMAAAESAAAVPLAPTKEQLLAMDPHDRMCTLKALRDAGQFVWQLSDYFNTVAKEVVPTLEELNALGPWTRVTTLQIIAELGIAEPGTLIHFMAETVKPLTKEEQIRRSRLEQHIEPDPVTGDTANPEWLKCRHMTGSTTPNAWDVGKYKTSKQQVVAWVWPELEEYGDACKYGNLTEDEVEETFLQYRRSKIGIETDDEGFVFDGIEIEHHGIICKQTCPILGHSPDGVAVETWRHPLTHEIKITRRLCEYKSRWYFRDLWKYRMEPSLRDEFDAEWFHHLRTNYGIRRLVDYKKLPLDFYDTAAVLKTEPPAIRPVPSQYEGQQQHGMRILGDDGFCDRGTPENPTFTWFVVWTPAAENVGNDIVGRQQFIERPSGFKGGSVTATGRNGSIQVTKVPFNPSYADKMHTDVLDLYLKKVLPAKFNKSKGLLAPGEIITARRKRSRLSGDSAGRSGSFDGSASSSGESVEPVEPSPHAARLERARARKRRQSSFHKKTNPKPKPKPKTKSKAQVGAALHNDLGIVITVKKKPPSATKQRQKFAPTTRPGKLGSRNKSFNADLGITVTNRKKKE